MAKSWTNKRWTLNWTGPKTNYKYRLVITPSDTTDITAVDEELPEDCLLDYEYSWEYDKYPVGMTNAQVLELTFKMDKCPADFAKALYDPFATIGYTINPLGSPYDIYTFDYGNVFEFYIAYDGENYIKVYTGVQQAGGESEYDFNEGTSTISTYDAGFFISSNIQMKYLDWYLLPYYADMIKDNGYLDWFYEYNSVKYYTCTACKGSISPGYYGKGGIKYHYWFMPLYRIFTAFDDMSLQFSKKIMRNTSLTKSLYSYSYIPTYTLPGYFKQGFTGDGSRGAALNYTDVYYLQYISALTTISGNNYVSMMGGTEWGEGGYLYAIKKEYETAWDYIKDFTAEHMVKSFNKEITPGALTFTAICATSYIYNPSTTIDLTDSELRDVKLETYEVLKSVDSVSIDKVEETLDKVTSTIEKNKNENSVSINHTTLNTPLAGATKKPKDIFRESNYTNQINNTELFYYDNTYAISGNRTIYRVHEKINIALSGVTDTDDILTIPDFNLGSIYCHTWGLDDPPDYSPKTNDNKGTGNITRQTVAQATGKLRIVADAMLYCFGDKFQYKLSATAWFDDFFYSNSNNVFYPGDEIYLDLSTIEPHAGMFDQIPNRFVILSIKLSKDEKVEFEAITKRATIT